MSIKPERLTELLTKTRIYKEVEELVLEVIDLNARLSDAEAENERLHNESIDFRSVVKYARETIELGGCSGETAECVRMEKGKTKKPCEYCVSLLNLSEALTKCPK